MLRWKWPRDPIPGLNEAFNADSRTPKVNLGVGVRFTTTTARSPARRQGAPPKGPPRPPLPRGYQPIEGPVACNSAVQNLLFGADSAIIRDGRVVTAQALGGTGALKIGGDLIKRIVRAPPVHLRPELGNHRALFEGRLPRSRITLLRPATRGANAEAMIAN